MHVTCETHVIVNCATMYVYSTHCTNLRQSQNEAFLSKIALSITVQAITACSVKGAIHCHCFKSLLICMYVTSSGNHENVKCMTMAVWQSSHKCFQ